MSLRLISTPLAREDKLDVVSVADVKAQARITDNSEDALIASYIEAAYDYMAGPNGWLNHCALLNESYEELLDTPLPIGFELKMRPLQTFTSLEVLGSDGAAYEVIPVNQFYVEAGFNSKALVRNATYRWPAYTYGLRTHGIYRVRYVAGYGTDPESIPAPIRTGIAIYAAHLFANREATSSEGRSAGQAIDLGLRHLCGRYKLAHDPS